MRLRIQGIPTQHAAAFRAGAGDANGQPALSMAAEGQGNPCRHCLGLIREGERKLVLSYRPFDAPQPYAESGPIFLHERDCERYEAEALPAWFSHLEPAIIRGYDENDWIVYETGSVVSGGDLEVRCKRILSRSDVAYVHIRSKFNCFQCRVERA